MLRSMSRRLSRRFLVVATLILVTFLWTATHTEAPTFAPVLFGFGHAKKPEPEPIRPEWVPLPGTERTKWQLGRCKVPEIELLRRPDLGLTDRILYSRRCVKPRHGKTDRDLIANITSPLISSTIPVNITDCEHPDLPPCDPFTLEVPTAYPDEQQAHLIFGVASTYKRMNESVAVFAHWMAGTGAQLVGIIADAENKNTNFNLSALDQLYHDHGIKATMIPPTIKDRIPRDGKEEKGPAPVEQLHFFLVRELLDRATPATQWIAILDDDTFFPSLYPLNQELKKHDHTKEQWLGALSDDFGHVRAWGYMAYGGAGVFMSVPLAKKIAPRIEQCIREATTTTGDGMLRDCIYSYSRTGLTLVKGLHQQDFRDDSSGFFESGIHPLSLHHWKSWYRAPVAAMARVATLVCGDCFLQRFRFGNNTILSNGYSVAVYAEDVLDKLDLNRVEGTWSQPTHDFDAAYGRIRPRLGRDEKKSYLLRDAVLQPSSDGSGDVFRQFYVFRDHDDDGKRAPGIDEVIELVWELEKHTS